MKVQGLKASQTYLVNGKEYNLKGCVTTYLIERMGAKEPYIAKIACSEVERRLIKVLGLSRVQSQAFITGEKELVRQQSVQGVPYLDPWMTPDQELPPPKSFTVSQLIAIIDEAHTAFSCLHERLSDKAFGIVCQIMCKPNQENGGSLYYRELFERLAKYNLTNEQIAAFVECEAGELQKLEGYGKCETSFSSTT